MQTFTKPDKIQVMNEFADWLQNQLDKRDWTAQDLAKESGLGGSTITRILTGIRGAGPEVCAKIALALDEEPENVFRLAGLLPEGNGKSAGELKKDEEYLLYWYRQCTDARKETVMDVAKGQAVRSMRRQQED